MITTITIIVLSALLLVATFLLGRVASIVHDPDCKCGKGGSNDK